jgi:uncharacterized membrane protein (DUF4010 family)
MQDFAPPRGVLDLAAALMLGSVIGLERGWRERESAEGSRVAGLRTFALIGLLGGILGVLTKEMGPLPAALGLGGLSLIAAVAYRENVRVRGSLSATTSVMMLLTFALGLLAGAGQPILAIGTAVISAVLLDLKPALHRWLRLVEQRELSAALQMLVLTAVVLPLLPDRGYGPFEALNPYRLWWAVILIAGLSLCGHLAVRLTGPSRGIFWTGLLGGLASSTAATLALARRTRMDPGVTSAATSGILAASSMMFLRMTALLFFFQPPLMRPMGAAMVAGAVVLLVASFLRLPSRPKPDAVASAPAVGDPFDLSAALGFGILLGVLALLTRAAQQSMGDTGLYLLSLLSGLLDVDAILLTVMHMNGQGTLPIGQAMIAAGLAVVANMIMKSLISWLAGGTSLGLRVTAAFAVAMTAAALTALMLSRA